MGDICILTKKYESNGDIAAIAFDASGGWSYGEFQIASRVGSMDTFLRYLQQPHPYLFNYLTFAGGVTGAVNGTARFKNAWKQLAAVHEATFAQAQEDFVIQQYYAPSVSALKKIGLDVQVRTAALSNVLASLSVMAGPGMAVAGGKGACGVFYDALAALGGVTAVIPQPDSNIIRQVYACKIHRLDDGTEYASSTDQVRAAVRKRMVSEAADALRLYQSEIPPTPPTSSI